MNREAKVSVFKNIRTTKNPNTTTIGYILDAIKSEKLKDKIDVIRDETNKNTRSNLKSNLPSICFSGTFSEREDSKIISKSGFICLDFDDFKTPQDLEETRKEIELDRYTYACFLSPSGNGLKVLVKITDKYEYHREHFLALKEYYNSPNFDDSSINESRVCYMSADKNIFINEDSVKFTAKSKPKENLKKTTVEVEVTDKDEIIKGLYSWWEKRFGIIEGERNRNTFILAMAFNEYGISEFDATNFMSQFEHDGFNLEEIKSCIRSAYKKTHLFGTKKFSDIEEYYENIDVKEESKTKVNFHDIYNTAFIDVTKDIEHPPTAISIGTHTISGKRYPTDFATYGNFSCITGASKSRKTFFKSLLVARYLGKASEPYSKLISSHDSDELFVFDVDTEQSKSHAHRVSKRVVKMLGVKDHEFYKPFSLRKFLPKERVEFVEWLIYESDFKNNIGLISIDGLADLIDDFNDVKESNRIIQKVMKWTDDKQFHLTTILHSNFGSTKAVGHVGSSAFKKAETICRVTTEENITTVNFSHTRGFPIEDFQFTIDDDALPIELACLESRVYKEHHEQQNVKSEETYQEPPLKPLSLEEAFDIEDGEVPF